MSLPEEQKNEKFLPKTRPNNRPPVEDLRLKLNRIRQQQSTSGKGNPPPDPPYNFLRDPLRDSSNKYNDTSKEESDLQSPNRVNKGGRGFEKETESTEHQKYQQKGEPFIYSRQYNRNRNGGYKPRTNKWEDTSHNPIEEPSRNPRKESSSSPKFNNLSPEDSPLKRIMNIKVEFSSETGERKCVVDDSKALPSFNKSKQPSSKPKKFYTRNTRKEQISSDTDGQNRNTRKGQISLDTDGQNRNTRREQISSDTDGQNRNTRREQISSDNDGQNRNTRKGQISSDTDGQNKNTRREQVSSDTDGQNRNTRRKQISSDTDGQNPSAGQDKKELKGDLENLSEKNETKERHKTDTLDHSNESNVEPEVLQTDKRNSKFKHSKEKNTRTKRQEMAHYEPIKTRTQSSGNRCQTKEVKERNDEKTLPNSSKESGEEIANVKSEEASK